MELTRGSVAALVSAAALLVAGALPAQAQYPGANGSVVVDAQEGPTNAPCFDQWLGSAWWYPVGKVGFSPDNTHVAQLVDNPQPAPKALPAGSGGIEVSSTVACAPRSIGVADQGTSLAYSPDGTRLAITRGGDVWVVDATTGKDVLDLTPGLPTTREADPAWDPKGRAIAYEATDGIRTRPPAGGASRLLVRGPAVRPDYSPDGTKIAYIDGTGHIAYADAVTGKLVQRTPISTSGYFTWSPDGKQFAFDAVDAEGNGYCATATTAGKVLTRNLGVDGYCQTLAWRRR
jgi:dipeptidyl aminopeptidase/acylaminoacyl peptidase